jgi:TonB family protein
VALSDPGPQPEAEAITDKHTELGVTTTRTTSDALRKTDDAVSQMPRYLHTPFPLYPFEARKKGQEGLVLLTVVILDNGRVGQVQIKKTSGYANLDQSAMMAVQNWRFEPLRKDNSLRSTIVNIPIRFSLKER